MSLKLQLYNIFNHIIRSKHKTRYNYFKKNMLIINKTNVDINLQSFYACLFR